MRVSGALPPLLGMRFNKKVRSMHNAISGNVNRSKFRRPKVSIVRTAGSANKKLIIPKPILPRSAIRMLLGSFFSPLRTSEEYCYS